MALSIRRTTLLPSTRRQPPPNFHFFTTTGLLRRPLHRFLFCFLLGFVGGLFPLVHHHLPAPSRRHPHQLPDLNNNQNQVDAKILNSSVSLLQNNNTTTSSNNDNTNKLVVVVTATYPRATQAFCLRRLAHTLQLVPPQLLWIVVEMGGATSPETANILRGTSVMHRHLVTGGRNMSRVKDRGVHQRNAALEHIDRHRLEGIVYFADDDNVYSLELFDRIRSIRNFGTWPVAMLAESKSKTIIEGPVCNGSRVIGWHTNEKSKRLRRFHVDMSGFAFKSAMLWDNMKRLHESWNPIRQLDTVKEGFQETTFIEQLVEDETQMEGIPPGCSRVMNYHLHIEAENLVYPTGWEISRSLDVLNPLK